MKVRLGDFNLEFFKSLPQNDLVIQPSKRTVYNTIIVDGTDAGIVGYIPTDENKQLGFVQILLAPAFRGKGLVAISEDLLVRKHHIKKLYATVNNKNAASLNAHLKIGYKECEKQLLEKWRLEGFLKNDQTRLYKDFSED